MWGRLWEQQLKPRLPSQRVAGFLIPLASSKREECIGRTLSKADRRYGGMKKRGTKVRSNKLIVRQRHKWGNGEISGRVFRPTNDFDREENVQVQILGPGRFYVAFHSLLSFEFLCTVYITRTLHNQKEVKRRRDIQSTGCPFWPPTARTPNKPLFEPVWPTLPSHHSASSKQRNKCNRKKKTNTGRPSLTRRRRSNTRTLRNRAQAQCTLAM